MIYILLIMSLQSNAGQSMSIQFNTLGACEEAKAVINQRVKDNYFTKDSFIVECVGKG